MLFLNLLWSVNKDILKNILFWTPLTNSTDFSTYFLLCSSKESQSYKFEHYNMRFESCMNHFPVFLCFCVRDEQLERSAEHLIREPLKK